MATRSQLVIEGNLVTKVTCEDGKNYDGSAWERKTIHGTVKLDEWLSAIRAQDGNIAFLPPISCGHIVAQQERGNKSCVVIQLPPAVRSFMYSPDNRLYRVAMPYIVIAAQFVGGAVVGSSRANRCGVFVFYRNAPISGLDDELLCANLPNLYEDGALCWGHEAIPVDAPLGRKIELVVEAIFKSNFNQHELDYQWRPAKRSVPGHPQGFEEWERMSQSDPSFVLQLAWRPAGKTVRQVLEEGVR